MKQKKLEKKHEELKQLKVKIKQNNEDWEQKNESLKHEKEKIMNSYRVLKIKLIEFRNMQHEKLKKLVKNSWECETKLKNYIKLAEKILKLAEISRRLEIDKEKILPYYENSEVEREDDNMVEFKLEDIKGVDPMIYEEIESLQNFWKRYNKVKLDVIAIKKQKEEVEKQNEILKNYLQQYYDGFHVNNVVMTNENPLLKIDKMTPNPKYYVVEERENDDVIKNESNESKLNEENENDEKTSDEIKDDKGEEKSYKKKKKNGSTNVKKKNKSKVVEKNEDEKKYELEEMLKEDGIENEKMDENGCDNNSNRKKTIKNLTNKKNQKKKLKFNNNTTNIIH